MLMKRKYYWVAMGVVLSHLSIAQVYNGNTPAHFGDCASCAAATQVNFPLDGSPHASLTDMVTAINAKLVNPTAVTAYTRGNGVNGALSLSQVPDALRAMNEAQASRMPQVAAQPPLVAPQFVMPTQQRLDSIFSPAWLQSSMPLQFMYPYTPAYMSAPAWMI